MVKKWKIPSIFALLLPYRLGIDIYAFHRLTAIDILQRLFDVGGPLLQEPIYGKILPTDFYICPSGDR